MPSTSARKHHPDRPEADHARTPDHSVGEDQLITDTAARTRAAIDAGEQAIAASVIYAGIVADGIPVHLQTFRLSLTAKTNPERIFVVPNAMAVTESSITGFTFNGREVGRKDA